MHMVTDGLALFTAILQIALQAIPRQTAEGQEWKNSACFDTFRTGTASVAEVRGLRTVSSF